MFLDKTWYAFGLAIYTGTLTEDVDHVKGFLSLNSARRRIHMEPVV